MTSGLNISRKAHLRDRVGPRRLTPKQRWQFCVDAKRSRFRATKRVIIRSLSYNFETRRVSCRSPLPIVIRIALEPETNGAKFRRDEFTDMLR